MDMEAAKLLAQTRLHCLVLEADKDAEQYKAKKYHDLLAELVGEAASDADADAPHPGHPQGSNFPSIPGDAAARPVFPVVSPAYTVYHTSLSALEMYDIRLTLISISWQHISRGVEWL